METLTAGVFRTASLQASIFTPEEEVSARKLERSFLPQLEERFNGEPLVLSFGELALPREAPRVLLQSADGCWRCEVSSARVNVYFRESVENAAPAAEDFFREAVSVFSRYQTATSCRIGRLAAVVGRYARHDNPGKFLAEHFCQDRWLEKPFNRPENFELHAHKSYRLNEFTVNSWVRCKTATGNLPSGEEPVVFIEQDLNTSAETIDSSDFAANDAAEFFRISDAEFDSILKLYFPE